MFSPALFGREELDHARTVELQSVGLLPGRPQPLLRRLRCRFTR